MLAPEGMASRLGSAPSENFGVHEFLSNSAHIKGGVKDFLQQRNPHDDIVDVAASMLDHKHRRRPVVLDGRLVGQVTCRQILKVIGEDGLKNRKKFP
jgi:Mg/Co/Ni transporter MgtE